MILFVVAALALLLGIVLLQRSQRRRKQLGLPNGDVFYQDHQGQPMTAVTLRSRVYNLRGKPDCLIRTAEGIIPVELKKSARPPSRGDVYPNHMIQVLAYIVLVREHYAENVPYGLLCTGTKLRARCCQQQRTSPGFEKWSTRCAGREGCRTLIAAITSGVAAVAAGSNTVAISRSTKAIEARLLF